MDVSTAIRGRRSIRKYRNDEVPRELLEEVLEEALWAPSGMNRQEWQLVVVRGETRDRLARVIAESARYIRPRLEELFKEKIVRLTLQFFANLGDAPVIVCVYIPKEKFTITEDMPGLQRYHTEFRRYNALLSASALMQNLLLAAYARGLGTCWMTAPKYLEDEINAVLGVEDLELVALTPIGYPDQSPPVPPRKGEKIRWIGF